MPETPGRPPCTLALRRRNRPRSPCTRRTRRCPTAMRRNRPSPGPPCGHLIFVLRLIPDVSIPLDVLGQAHLYGVLWSISENPLRLLDTQRSAEWHEIIALHILDLRVLKVLPDDIRQLLDRSGAAIGHIQDLAPCGRVVDGQADPIDQILDVGEIEQLAAVAVDAQLGAAQRVFDKDLADSPADAPWPVQRRRPDDGVGQVEHLPVGDHQLLAGQFQRTVDPYGVKGVFLICLGDIEVAVHHVFSRYCISISG